MDIGTEKMKFFWSLLIPILVFCAFTYYLIGVNFSAKLGLIDDHEIAMFLGSDGEIKPSEIPGMILSTEVGNYGQALRYRPAYYSLRIIETALWRDKAILWYAVRFFFFVTSMYLLWKIARFFFPTLIAYLSVPYLFTLTFWPDIMTRLGPAEIYAVPAMIMSVYGLIEILRSGKHGWWPMTIGYLICAGSKENFVILLLPILAVAIYRWSQKKINRAELMAYLICLAMTLFITIEIVSATSVNHADVYGSTISYKARVLKLWEYKRYIVVTRKLYLIIAAGLVFGLTWLRQLWRQGIRKALANPVFTHFVVMGIVGVIIVSQYLFYDNGLPMNMRYDFPGMPLFSVLNLIIVHLLLNLLPKRKWWYLLGKMSIYSVVAGYSLYVIVSSGYSHIRMSAKANAAATVRFDESLQVVVAKLQIDPNLPLLMISNNYLDYEPIVSISRFLAAKKVSNPLILDYREPTEYEKNSLSQALVPQLLRIEQNGSESPTSIFAHFSPLSRLTADTPCYSITFGKQVLPTPCTNLTSF